MHCTLWFSCDLTIPCVQFASCLVWTPKAVIAYNQDKACFGMVCGTLWSTFCMHCLQPQFWAARYNTWLLIRLTPKGVVFSFLFSTTTVVLWLCRGRPEFEMWSIHGTLHRSAGAPTPAAPLSRFLPPNGIHGIWSASCPMYCTLFESVAQLRAMTFCLYTRKEDFLALSAIHTVGTATA